jgi:hypothetical protein
MEVHGYLGRTFLSKLQFSSLNANRQSILHWR